MSVYNHHCLWHLEIFEFTGKEIGELKQESEASPRYFYKVLPEFCLHPERGTIQRSEDFLQWVDSGDDKYILFNSLGADEFLSEEISNVGLEDVFEDVDLRPWFNKLFKIPYSKWFKRRYNESHLVVSVVYWMSHDWEYGWELDEVTFGIEAYLDSRLLQRDLEDNLKTYTENLNDPVHDVLTQD